MRSVTCRIQKPSAAFALLFLLFLPFPAPAATDPFGRPSETRLPIDKAVRLQIRISEAKRKPDSVRYYKSAARCRKKGGAILSSSSRHVKDGVRSTSSN